MLDLPPSHRPGRPSPEDASTGTARPQAIPPAATPRKTPPGPQPHPRKDLATDQPRPPPGKAWHRPAEVEVEVEVEHQPASPKATAALRPPPDDPPPGTARHFYPPSYLLQRAEHFRRPVWVSLSILLFYIYHLQPLNLPLKNTVFLCKLKPKL